MTLILACQLAAQTLAPTWDDVYYKRPACAHGWKYIVIHNSATASGNAKSFDAYHTQMGYGGLAYHFVIGNGHGSRDGQVEEGFRWKKQMAGTHVTVNAWYHNIYGIGICLVGDFERTRPTTKQLLALDSLVCALQQQYGIPAGNIIGHDQVPWGDISYDADSLTVVFRPGKHERTSCPGKYLSIGDLRRRCRDRPAGTNATVLP
ncbi:MAG TPA: peptidoglycan recognition family protein [Candidatus Edwardsbacteria bacterium]|nr:peptidoglycan recognition family protein [Candidatus Edwardsbacteria bacterium]